MEAGKVSATAQRPWQVNNRSVKLQAALHVGLGRQATGEITAVKARPAPRLNRPPVSQPVLLPVRQVNS